MSNRPTTESEESSRRELLRTASAGVLVGPFLGQRASMEVEEGKKKGEEKEGQGKKGEEKKGKDDDRQQEQQRQFVAHLSDANVPPSEEYEPYTATNAFGIVACQLDQEETQLEYALIVANMQEMTGIHIHQGGPEENGPHLAELENFSRPQTGSFLLRNTVAQGMECPTESGDDNCLTQGVTFEELVEHLREGTAYVQAHAAPEGRRVIRGQLG